MKVEIQEEWYSPKQCQENPNKIYIFGDNSIFKGKAGQANIRNCTNSFGIPTKRFPTMEANAFMRDTPKDYEYINVEFKTLKKIIENKMYDTIVFPKDGLGTGLAKMPETSPKLFQALCDKLEKKFEIKMTKDGFI